ncbi:MAG: hypothetical protein WCT20_05610 [Candidatus Babeliales bacterium]
MKYCAFLRGLVLILFTLLSSHAHASMDQRGQSDASSDWEIFDLSLRDKTADVVKDVFIHAAGNGSLLVIQHFVTTPFLRDTLDFESIRKAFDRADKRMRDERRETDAVVSYFIQTDFLCDALDFIL